MAAYSIICFNSIIVMPCKADEQVTTGVVLATYLDNKLKFIIKMKHHVIYIIHIVLFIVFAASTVAITAFVKLSTYDISQNMYTTLTYWPLSSEKCNRRPHITHYVYEHVLWNCPQVNATEHLWWSVYIGSVNEPEKTWTWPMLTNICVSIWRNWATMCWCVFSFVE